MPGTKKNKLENARCLNCGISIHCVCERVVARIRLCLGLAFLPM